MDAILELLGGLFGDFDFQVIIDMIMDLFGSIMS